VPSLIVKSADGRELRVPLHKRITTAGRSRDNDIVLDDAGMPDTALHVHFNGEDFTVACHDQVVMSVNGRRKTTCRLGAGDVIRLGSSELAFSSEERSPALPAPPASRRPETLRALVRFSERLLGAKGLESLLDALIDALLEVTHADKGFLILLDETGLQVKAARNLTRGTIEDAVSRISDSIVQRVLETARPLVVADALHDQEWSSSSSVVNLKLCSVMCAPLMVRGEVFGVIYLGNDSVVSLFGDQDLEALTVFTAQASLLVQNALLLDGLRRENVALREAAAARRYGDLVGAGSAMREVFRRVEKVAATDVSVLITGDTGTGKDLVAREIHRRSPRASGPFIAINCGAIPEALLESELFGHVKGAFTGAVATRQGRFHAAHGGTLFLDEIGDMPLLLQVKLLRALQDREVTRVGDTRPESVDIRIVAATHAELSEEIKHGRFREDLFYRLNVVSIHLPPLRERRDDIPVLAKYFLQSYAREFDSRVRGFVPAADIALRKYGWPGNIRELENRVKKAVVLADGPLVTVEDLDLGPESLDPILPLAQAKEEFQKRYINEILERNNGNRTKTAKDLGVDPRTVFRHLERLEGERRGEARSEEETA
jgi:transcriptional regulator with GAF, ATPase, and Fis domain